MMKMVKSCAALVAGGLMAAGVAAEQQARPLSEQAYLGLLVRDHPETGGAIVGWILPGPLQGTGFASPRVNRGDVILAVNGEPMGAAEFEAFLGAAAPGDELVLSLQRTGGATGTAVPQAGEGQAVEEMTVTLAARSQWAGPVSFPRKGNWFASPDEIVPVAGEATPLEAFIADRIEELELIEPVRCLLDYLAELQQKGTGRHTLKRVAYGFHRPTRLNRLQQAITGNMDRIPAEPSRVIAEMAANLDLPAPAIGAPIDPAVPDAAIQSLAGLIEQAAADVEAAWAAVPEAQRDETITRLLTLMDVLETNVYFMHRPDAPEIIQALQTTMEIDHPRFLAAAATLGGLMDAAPGDSAALGEGRPSDVDGVDGGILASMDVNGRIIVYGGTGPNRYDLSKVTAVIDAGGNDEFDWGQAERHDVRVVIDLAGNDVHRGESAGPACGVGGVALLVDHAGADRYEGRSRAAGVGLLGVGIVLDRAGPDVYTGTAWSQGVGWYGSGAILDLGGDADVYQANVKSQGVGGPYGFGLLIDEAGRDLYRANGPVGSAYGTPAVYQGFSQGVGFGIRLYESGGIGVLTDLAGDDRYEAGEFSQGGAYYWALGVLHDRAGNDLYYGNRYGQAFAAHQALGILADDAGDDTYWSMTAASQSGSWDGCATLLIDRAGNDSYQADGLAQGAAAQQALAWLVDLDGRDRYIAPPGATRGQSGGNDYHYDATGCFSFSLLLDAGGDDDVYSAGRDNAQIVSTGARNDESPGASGLHGAFIDAGAPVTE